MSCSTYAKGIEAINNSNALGVDDTAAATAAALEAAATAAADKQHVKRAGTRYAEYGITGDSAHLVLAHIAGADAAGDYFNVKFLSGRNKQPACAAFSQDDT